MNKVYFYKSLLLTFILALSFPFGIQAQTPDYHYGLGTGANSFPLNTTTSNKVQWLYVVSEFNTGVPPAGMIDKVYLKRSSTSTNPSVFQGLYIKIGMVPATMTQFTAGAFWTTDMVEVLAPSAVTIPSSPTDSWVEFELDQPFLYDGTSNIVLEVAQQSYTAGFSLRNVGTGTTNRRIWGPYGSTTPTSIGTGPVDFGFNIIPGGMPDVMDIGISAFNMPQAFCYGEQQDAIVTVKNHGSYQVDTFNIGWSIDGTPQAPFGFNEHIDTLNGLNDDIVVVTLEDLDFPQGPSEVKFWTFLPNDQTDEFNPNDTITVLINALKYFTTVDEVLCLGDSLVVGDTTLYDPVQNLQLDLISSNGCDSIVTVSLAFNPPINISWDGGAEIACVGESVIIDATHPNGYSYFWNNLSSDPSITVSNSGVYSVTVKDEDEVCVTNASYTVEFKSLPQINDLPTQTVYCEGDSVILNAGFDGVSYLWSTGATTPTIKVGESGTYHVLVTNEFGCENTNGVTLNFYPLPGFESWEMLDLGNFKYQFYLENPNGVIAYHWDFGDGTSSVLEMPIKKYEGPGVYTVFLTLESLCGTDDFYRILELEDGVNIHELSKNENLKLYPNPADNILNVSIKEGGIQAWKMLDIHGRLLQEMNLSNKMSDIEIQLSGMEAGTYLLQLETDKGVEIVQFIKK